MKSVSEKQSLINLKNICVTRGDEMVLSDLNLDLQKGENLLVIGDNGAGKTTFLKLLCGLIHPNTGSIRLYNENTPQKLQRNFQQKIAYIPQDLGLVEESSVERNILLGTIDTLNFFQTLFCLFPSCAQNRAQELMETLEITHLRTKKVRHLSGGERKKVAIARAFMRSPEILLIDEMLSDLAPKAAQNILDDLAVMQKQQGFSVVFVEHHINNVLEMTDKLVTLEQGNFTHKITKPHIADFVDNYFFKAA